MQPCGGCSVARRLLADPAATPSSAESTDAQQQAHLERVLGATTIVLLLSCVTYMAVSALYACLRAPRFINAPPGNDDLAPGTREDTKRALEGIPVRVVVHSRDGDGGGRMEGAEAVADETGQGADADDCAVCLAEYAAGDEVRVLPACGHGFHRECVDRWLLTRAPTCPVCRAPVAAPVEEVDASKDDCAIGHADGSFAIPAP